MRPREDREANCMLRAARMPVLLEGPVLDATCRPQRPTRLNIEAMSAAWAPCNTGAPGRRELGPCLKAALTATRYAHSTCTAYPCGTLNLNPDESSMTLRYRLHSSTAGAMLAVLRAAPH